MSSRAAGYFWIWAVVGLLAAAVYFTGGRFGAGEPATGGREPRNEPSLKSTEEAAAEGIAPVAVTADLVSRSNPGGELDPPAAAPENPRPSLPEHYVRVRVVDAHDRPLPGQAVVLRSKRFLGDPRDLANGFCDSEGEAILHSRDLDRLMTQESQVFGKPSLSVVADVPDTKTTAVAVAQPLELDRVYELKLPALGAVAVNVLGPDGRPFLEQVRVSARWVPTVEVGTEVYGGYHRCADQNRVTSTGRTVYAAVGADISMTFLAVAEGYGNGSAVDVPITATYGTTQEVTVQLGERRPQIRCRVLMPNGQPLGQEALKARVWHAPESERRRPYSYPFEVQSGKDGVVTFFFTRELDQTHSRRLVLERDGGGSNPSINEDWSQAWWDLPNELSTAAMHDLGTATLVEPEVLQEGFVFHANGEPASSVRLSFSVPTGDPGKRARHGSGGMSYSARDGSFLLRGFERPEALDVDLQGHRKHNGRSHRVYGGEDGLTVGDRGVTLFMGPPPEDRSASFGALALTALYDEDVPGSLLTLHLEHDGDGDLEPLPLAVFAEHDRPVKLVEGTWRLRVTAGQTRLELVRIEGLQVIGQETLTDSRLTPLDLRGLARRWDLAVQRPNGAPWRGKRLQLRAPGLGGPSVQVRTLESGELNLVLPSEFQVVELSPDGSNWTTVDLGEASAGTEPVTLRESED